MLRKKWLVWPLIAAMLANNVIVAFASVNEGASAGLEAAPQAADVLEETEEIKEEQNESESLTHEMYEEDIATASNAAITTNKQEEEEIVLTASDKIPWIDLVDVPDQFSAAAQELENADGTLYFDEAGVVSGVGGYYGDQLNRQKAADIYDALYGYYENVIGEDGEPSQNGVNPYGTDGVLLTYTVDSQEELSTLLAAVKEEMGGYGRQAYYAFLYDHPEMFWKFPLFMKYKLGASGSDAAGWTAEITMTLDFAVSETKSEIQNMAGELEAAVGDITASCEGKADSYEAVKSAHDSIAGIASYDTTLSRTYAHSAYGVLVEGLGVCESYAKALSWFVTDLVFRMP